MGDLAAEGLGRGHERVVERRRREQQVDRDEARDERHVERQQRRRAVSAQGVLPDHRDAVVGLAVPVEVGVVLVEARAPELGPGREIVEPAPAGAAAPGDHLPAGEPGEVELRVGVGLAAPGVGVEAEVVTAVPVHEVDRVLLGPPLVVSVEPALDGGSVDEQHLVGHLDVRDLVGLRVVERLVERARPRPADRGEVGEEAPLEVRPLVDDPVVEAILEPQLAPGEPVELRVADERLRGRWQGAQERRLVDGGLVEADEHDPDRKPELVGHELAGPERLEGVGRPGAPGRRGHRQQAQQREETRPTANEAHASRPGHVPPSRRSER